MAGGDTVKLRKPKSLYFSLLAPVLLIGGTLTTFDHFEKRGRQFFETGRGAVETLGSLARALKGGDLDAAGRLYSPDFRGSSLGLTHLRRGEARDGIESLCFAPDGSAMDRAAALAEWRSYLDGFESI